MAEHYITGACPHCGQPYERQPGLEVGRLKADRDSMRVFVDGVERPQFSRCEFEFLWAVAAKKGGVAPHWHLMNATGTDSGDENVLKVVLCKTRKKLGDPGLIQTVWGSGYRLNV